MVRGIIAAIGLVALWLLMSGLYKTLVLILGAASIVLTMVVVGRMDRVDGHKLGYDLKIFATFKYLLWLLAEIAKSNWAVTKIILSGCRADRQKLFSVPVSQKSEVAQVVFANSITLTPGTITVESIENCFYVHALDFGDGDMDALLDMDKRVTELETPNVREGN